MMNKGQVKLIREKQPITSCRAGNEVTGMRGNENKTVKLETQNNEWHGKT